MTKKDLVNVINQETQIEKYCVKEVIEKLMSEVKKANKRGENVFLRGFGTFGVVQRAEKTGRNISKGTSVIIPAHKYPKFIPCKEFKNAVKKG